ncbi:2-polyprenyl-6-methoxyphenol hydroxylase-like FAD-dependent oxidoreductase [Variovorax paradoxus]|uniref:FAD-dependent oxidoreductase n=1 Tax=Variovorax paradoxus TaxID=34073 RepID=UPI00278D4AD0|nr:FAD-dependent oxidoreductase [Variovorax paradoxus]MDQ0572721.1 2-polyprenyl-6-methoxyphenol hydroxylase-like FAD-dependent oxidoreductase [Variovorax paradoxus]
MTDKTLAADVLIVGAGPVGLTLAMDLASHGVSVILCETRRFAEPPSVKCNHVSSRTMEQFRRLGVAEKLRDAGLPADHPNDVVFRTSATGMELARIPIPCRRDRYTETEGPDAWWPTPEPPHRINQIYLEPILLRHTAALPGVQLLNRSQVTAFTQDCDGVSATATDLDSHATRHIRCRYMVGCDGGSSMVRKQIGATLEGTAVIQRVQSTFIRAPELRALIPGKPAWSYYAMNPRRCGTMFAIDGQETWLVHNHLNAEEPEFDSVDRDRSLREILGVGPDFSYEIISKEDWVGRRLVANRFREGRVFLAGDAAHLWVPYAGYGMNAGIADALNLSWLLAACVQGWGDDGILDAYEAERLPITEQVSNFAMDHAQKMIRARRAVPQDLEAPGPEGDALRAEIGREAYDLNVQQFCCAGLNFGYFYTGSPIIVADGEHTPPAYSMGGFTPSTVPGCRAPHFWLTDGRSLYDAFGPGYTLLRFDRSADVSALERAARAYDMPLAVVDIDAAEVPPAYMHRLVLCRADQHVAWRGAYVPPDAYELVAQLRGERRHLQGRRRLLRWEGVMA